MTGEREHVPVHAVCDLRQLSNSRFVLRARRMNHIVHGQHELVVDDHVGEARAARREKASRRSAIESDSPTARAPLAAAVNRRPGARSVPRSAPGAILRRGGGSLLASARAWTGKQLRQLTGRRSRSAGAQCLRFQAPFAPSSHAKHPGWRIVRAAGRGFAEGLRVPVPMSHDVQEQVPTRSPVGRLAATAVALGAALTLLGVCWIRATAGRRWLWSRFVHRPLLSFFVLANLLSWLAWAPLVAAGLHWTNIRCSPYVHLAGGLGPLLAALVVTAAREGRAGLTRLWEACIAVRGRLGWIAFAAAAPVALFTVSAAALRVAGQGQVAWADIGRSVEYPALSRGMYWFANVFFYGFGEEVGWRGFALPHLQARKSALASALLLAAAWATWHLPLFAFAGGLASMGIAGVAGWLFSLVTGSILMTWLFNSSRGSVWAVALFHGVLDIVMTSPVKGPLPSVMGAILAMFGLAVPFIFGATNLARERRVQASNGDTSD